MNTGGFKMTDKNKLYGCVRCNEIIGSTQKIKQLEEENKKLKKRLEPVLKVAKKYENQELLVDDQTIRELWGSICECFS